MSEIRLEFTYTKEEAVRANRELLASLRPTRFPRVMVVLKIAFAIFMLFNGITMIGRRGIELVSIMVIFVGLAVLFFRPFIGWMSVRSFNKLPAADKPVRWTISAERLAVEGATGSSSFQWNSIIKVRESKRGFLLFSGPLVAQWLPITSFANDADKEMFRSWIQENGTEFNSV